MSALPRSVFAEALTYPAFQALVTRLAHEHRTSGPEQHPFLIQTTQQNQAVLDADHGLPLLPELVALLRQVPNRWFWAVLGEAWCGDTAHQVQLLAHLASESENQVELRILLRSEHPDVMAAYQTNGKDSIPKLVCLEADTMQTLGTWGPRPAAAQQLAEQLHANKELHATQVSQQMNEWYNADQGQSFQRELLPLVAEWVALRQAAR
ncbi:MAG TPA: thioredoxin family protein [Hymenobacter sp.]|jgi:hypothetical protein